MKSCFIFDIDGTLIDSEAVDHKAMQSALREQGMEFSQEQLRPYFGRPGRFALEDLGVSDIDGTMRRWEELAYAELDQIQVFDGIEDTLVALRARGARLGIVTSRTKYQFAQGVAPIGLTHYFDAYVCADEVAHPKPAPDSMLECLRRLDKSAEQAVYIGDGPFDMKCAEAAGVTSVLALWGAHAPENIRSDCRLQSPKEILEL